MHESSPATLPQFAHAEEPAYCLETLAAGDGAESRRAQSGGTDSYANATIPTMTTLLGLSTLGLAACGGGGTSPTATSPAAAVTTDASTAVVAAPATAAPSLSSPTGLSAAGGNAMVTLTWVATTGATSYTVSRGLKATGPVTILGTSTSPAYKDSAVTNGTTYYYLVSARNASSSSGNSDVVSATPATVTVVPAIPGNLVAAAGNKQVSLTWTASAGATSYSIFRALATGGPYTLVGAAPASPYSDTTVSNGTAYYYVVKANNAAGNSGYSAQVAATPTSTIAAPPTPTGLAATPGSAQVSLTWGASVGATTYVLSRQTLSAGAATPTATFTPVATTSSTRYIDTGVSNGTLYAYVVAATNAVGQSPVSTAVTATPIAVASTPLSRTQAARFLAQAAFGGTDSDVQSLQAQANGIHDWLAQQFALPVNPAGQLSNIAWMQANNLNSVEFDENGVQSSFWRKLISSPDVLRQRVMLALTNLFVINTRDLPFTYRGTAAAYYLDRLEANAFGNFKDLLLAVSHTPAMGQYLTYLNSVKANPITGASPDENYAREIMQLFSIGVVQLNLDGTPVPNPNNTGVALATYSQTDVLNMAKVFTGWQLSGNQQTGFGAALATDMVNNPANFDTTAKTVLGQTIAAGLTGEQTLEAAIGILMQQPSMAPFISRQFIQRLVTSNPSPDYVYRVAQIFQSTQGDMKSVITAILTDTEATSGELLSNPQAGKLREPVVRFVQWARTFQLNFSPGTAAQWATVGNLTLELGQSPLWSPTVFFFFQPGYVPPQSPLQASGITAPEFGITNETSVAEYMNFMQGIIINGIGGVPGNYAALLPLANQGGNSAALLAELNMLLAAGQISAPTLTLIQSALDTMPVSTPTWVSYRVYAAIILVMCAPEYLIQK